MKTITCPKCGTEIRVIPYGFGEIGVCEDCGYLHNAKPDKTIMNDIEVVKTVQELMGVRP